MKVVAINGSPKNKGNTNRALEIVGAELRKQQIDFVILHIGNRVIRGCTACGLCKKNQDNKCSMNDDLNLIIPQLMEADGLILGSPVYYSGIAGTMKSFLDRLFYVSSANGNFFRHKVGAAICAVRRSGGLPTFQSLNNYFTYSEMFIPTSNYWNVIHGTVPGDVEQDGEGVQIARVLGKNMAWLLKVVELGKKEVPAPVAEKKEVTCFVR
ncbi:MAG: FMN reductase [Bdellovibrionales bacterium RIFOXYB1_FULL_37_110]|nr:MAG: FMN reductase [Bdellovibrionales bacterium RIFOXYC1_FULL_37_79]OFZ59095.1 MAG: FMN reductase [Bdellovibrionales bacterium RIFOXYB1_FULL_37_110]OFZ64102.1 MAG: FMN reductase [Bdellovibrionales bacterium RIFOXYD1_FULL_36_51]